MEVFKEIEQETIKDETPAPLKEWMKSLSFTLPDNG